MTVLTAAVLQRSSSSRSSSRHELSVSTAVVQPQSGVRTAQ